MEKTEAKVERHRLMTPFLVFTCVVLLVTLMGFTYQNQRRNDGLDKFESQLTELQITVGEINQVARQVNNPEAVKAQQKLVAGLNSHVADSAVARGTLTEQMNEICQSTGWCTPR